MDNVKQNLKSEESCPFCFRVDFGQNEHFKRNKTESDLPPIKENSINNKLISLKNGYSTDKNLNTRTKTDVTFDSKGDAQDIIDY